MYHIKILILPGYSLFTACAIAQTGALLGDSRKHLVVLFFSSRVTSSICPGERERYPESLSHNLTVYDCWLTRHLLARMMLVYNGAGEGML